MAFTDDFLSAVASMEAALANALSGSLETATPEEIERLLRLIIKKEIVLEFLLGEVFPPAEECPCKYRLGIAGNAADATVIVTDPEGNEDTFEGTINLTAIQCFTGGPNCNPAVNNFAITFGDNGNTINLTQGRRGIIACVDNTTAIMQNGTAQASGNVLDGNFIVDFTYTIDTATDTATVEITAIGQDGSTFETTFTADVSPETFIGDCDETVGP